VFNATVSCGNCVVAGASEDDAVEDAAVDDDAVEDDAVEDDAVEDDAVEDDAVDDDAVDDDAVDVPAGDVVLADESPCVGATVACVAAADCDFDVLSVPHAAMSNPPTASATAISRRPLICGTVTAPPASNALSGESGSASDSAARAALVSWRPRNVTR